MSCGETLFDDHTEVLRQVTARHRVAYENADSIFGHFFLQTKKGRHSRRPVPLLLLRVTIARLRYPLDRRGLGISLSFLHCDKLAGTGIAATRSRFANHVNGPISWLEMFAKGR